MTRCECSFCYSYEVRNDLHVSYIQMSLVPRPSHLLLPRPSHPLVPRPSHPSLCHLKVYSCLEEWKIRGPWTSSTAVEKSGVRKYSHLEARAHDDVIIISAAITMMSTSTLACLRLICKCTTPPGGPPNIQWVSSYLLPMPYLEMRYNFKLEWSLRSTLLLH